jgi:hypothetical protein
MKYRKIDEMIIEVSYYFCHHIITLEDIYVRPNLQAVPHTRDSVEKDSIIHFCRKTKKKKYISRHV